MYEKHLEIIGGEYSGGGSDDDNRNTPRVFVERNRKNGTRARAVIRESDLGTFFRRDWEMAGMDAIKIIPTTLPLTENY